VPSGFGKGGCVGAGPAEHDAWTHLGPPEPASKGIGRGLVWHGGFVAGPRVTAPTLCPVGVAAC